MKGSRNKGITEFLQQNLKMDYVLDTAPGLTELAGEYEVYGQGAREDEPPQKGSFSLRIVLPQRFPLALPRFYVEGERPPLVDDEHLYPDGSLCLASPRRMKMDLVRHPSEPALLLLAKSYLDPYLYCVLLGRWAYGELAHGAEGIAEDYKRMLDLESLDDVLYALCLLTLSREEANRQFCPCRCGRSLKKCPFRSKLNEFRRLGEDEIRSDIAQIHAYLRRLQGQR